MAVGSIGRRRFPRREPVHHWQEEHDTSHKERLDDVLDDVQKVQVGVEPSDSIGRGERMRRLCRNVLVNDSDIEDRKGKK